jgi:Tol biopolymer transport system component
MRRTIVVTVGAAAVVTVVAAALLAWSTPRPVAATGVVAQESTRVVTRRVWAGDDVNLDGAPSPDGRYLSFTDAPGGELAIRDLVTGQSRRVTGAGAWRSYAETSAFSPDGLRLVYEWYNDSLARSELRLIGVDGTGLRVLVSDSAIEGFGPPDWSANGRDIAVRISRKDHSNALAVVAVESGTLRTLRSFDWRAPRKVSFSRDGRFVAYDFPPSEESPARDVYVVAVDGRSEARATEHPANDEILGWAPDGRTLYFLSDREGTEGVWALPMREGRPVGAPTSVRRDLWHVTPLGFSRDSYFYGVTLESPSLYTAVVDPARAQVVTAPVEFLGRQSLVWAADWSPDGRRIAFTVPPRGRPWAPSSVLGIQTIETGELREIPTALDFINVVGRPRWAPDARSIVVSGQQRGRGGIFRIELATGRTDRLASGGYPELSPDGRTLYFVRSHSADSTNYGLVARDLATAAERVLCRCSVVSLALSPDGSTLAFVPPLNSQGGTSIRLIPTQGGTEHVLHESRTPVAIMVGYGGLAWSRDGQRVLFARRGGEPGTRWELMVIPVAGGEPRKLLDAPMIMHLRVHPDGRRIVWGGGQFRAEVWVLENLPGMSATTGAAPSPR